MAYRKRLSRGSSKRSFARGAVSVQSVNTMSPMRGGYRF